MKKHKESLKVLLFTSFLEIYSITLKKTYVGKSKRQFHFPYKYSTGEYNGCGPSDEVLQLLILLILLNTDY